MKKSPQVVLMILLSSTSIFAQQPDMWHILAEVGFETRPSRETGYQIESPRFSKNVWSYDGKKIKVKGYLIPMAELGGRNEYMLSALPFNQCYFCGGAGPETVVEVQTKQTIKFVTRQIVIEGTLVLNDKDPDHHMYILKDAKLIE